MANGRAWFARKSTQVILYLCALVVDPNCILWLTTTHKWASSRDEVADSASVTSYITSVK